MIRIFVSCMLLFSSCGAGNNKAAKQLMQETITFQILLQNTYGG